MFQSPPRPAELIPASFSDLGQAKCWGLQCGEDTDLIAAVTSCGYTSGTEASSAASMSCAFPCMYCLKSKPPPLLPPAALSAGLAALFGSVGGGCTGARTSATLSTCAEAQSAISAELQRRRDDNQAGHAWGFPEAGV
jgi:hypothetical protein